MSSSTSSAASPACRLDTAHGPIELPVFLPDATRGAVRAVDAEDLGRVGIRALMANAFHLGQRPGVRSLQQLGGLHAFTGFDGPIVTDSGGFQILSLIRENPKLGTVRDDQVLFRNLEDRRRSVLTPEKAVTSQLRLGSDVLVALDDCPRPEADQAETEASVRRSVAWFRLSRETLERLRPESPPPLVAVVHGGDSEPLRRRCAEALRELGARVFGFGGWPLDAEGRFLVEAFEGVHRAIPAESPLFALGIGKPEHLVAACAVRRNVVFDCSLPTRDARHQRLYRFREPEGRLDPAVGAGFYEKLYVLDKPHARSREPVSEHCDCPTCQRYSLGYLHHLFRVKDPLALRLATLHNLRFYARLIERLRSEGGA